MLNLTLAVQYTMAGLLVLYTAEHRLIVINDVTFVWHPYDPEIDDLPSDLI